MADCRQLSAYVQSWPMNAAAVIETETTDAGTGTGTTIDVALVLVPVPALEVDHVNESRNIVVRTEFQVESRSLWLPRLPSL